MEGATSDFKERLIPGTVSLASFLEFIGHLTPLSIQINDVVIKSTLLKLNPCLKYCFHDILKDKSDESSKNVCKICVVLHSQLCHFGNCMAKLYSCPICLQLYRLLRGHMELCKSEEPQRVKFSSSDICFVLLEAMGVDGISFDSEKFWFRLKKVASEIVIMQSSVTPSTVTGPRLNEAGSHLKNYSPQHDNTNTYSWRTSSSFKRSVNTEESNLKSSEVTSEHSVQGLDRQNRSEHAVLSQNLNAQFRESVSFHRNWLKNKMSSGSATQDPYDTQKTYGESGLMSLPLEHNFNQGGQRFSSLETRPVGQPGIGEVVYGTREQLRIVAEHWSKIKRNMKDSVVPNQLREEGVIISKYKKQLRILRTLYQKHYQWERLSHLGTGAAGKCHLAMDLTSKFKFCVKRLNIHNYAKEELTVWCDLEHENIVHLFGALRQGENIYILSEFIDGGNLTACINEQKAMNRRLSHVMALIYFRQLLQVLVYLKSKGILHEDIKSDNILLRRGSTSIAVCDFGLARYITQEKDFKGQCPSGTPTQWSPEKAASYGHGFPSEVWAAVCVLVHIMSGDPPWLKRFGDAAMLHFIIFQKSPPIEDVPSTVREEMLDLIKMGFAVDEKKRPSAEILLKHPVFREIGVHDEPDKYFSILGSEKQQISNGRKQQMDVIVENFQEIIVPSGSSRADIVQSSAIAAVNLTQKVGPGDKLQKFRIRQEVLDASARLSHTTHSQSDKIDSHNLPKLSILEQINSENDDQAQPSTMHLQSLLRNSEVATVHNPPTMQTQENCDNTDTTDRGESGNQPSILRLYGGLLDNSPDNLYANMDNINIFDLSSSQDNDTNLYQKFVEDDIDMRTINGYKPTLTLYKNPDAESVTSMSEMADNPAQCVPCDFRKNAIKTTNRSALNGEILKQEPLVSPTYLRKQKGLHLDITKPTPGYIHQDLPMQSAPVISSNLSKKIPSSNIPQTASAISDSYPSSFHHEGTNKKLATKSSAERNKELEDEREKLLANLDIPYQMNQEEGIDDEKLEDWHSVLQIVQNRIPDQKIDLLRFWDESGKELICTVRTDPTITEWKDLFNTSPIVQKIQEKNVHHFTLFYVVNGEINPVDHLEPIDKDKHDLNISPTAPECPDCWCPIHLNV